MSEYPQHDKFHEARQPREVNDVVGEFIEWLHHKGFEIARWVDQETGLCQVQWPTNPDFVIFQQGEDLRKIQAELDGEPFEPRMDVPDEDAHPGHCRCRGTGEVHYSVDDQLVADHRRIPQWIADFMGIDYQAFMDEKEQMPRLIEAYETAHDELTSLREKQKELLLKAHEADTEIGQVEIEVRALESALRRAGQDDKIRA